MLLGIVGTSIISEQLIQATQLHKDIELFGIVSRSQEKALFFQKKYSVPHHFTTVSELAKSDVEAVYIASPNALHFSQAKELLEQGKHVLLEKPFTSTYREMNLLFDIAQKNNLTLMEAMKTTCLPNFIELQKTVSLINNIKSVFISYCKRSSRYDDLLKGKESNVFSKEMSGGSLMDLGVYGIWVAVALFGEPLSVKHEAELLFTGVDGSGELVLHYPNFDVSIHHAKTYNESSEVCIVGKNHTIKVPDFSNITGFYVDEKYITVDQIEKNIFYELDEFYHAVHTQKQSTLNTWGKSRMVLEILEESRKQANIIFTADSD